MKAEYALQLVSVVIFSILFFYMIYCAVRSAGSEHYRRLRHYYSIIALSCGTAILYISIAAFTDDTAGKAVGAIACVILLITAAASLVLVVKEIKMPTT